MIDLFEQKKVFNANIFTSFVVPQSFPYKKLLDNLYITFAGGFNKVSNKPCNRKHFKENSITLKILPLLQMLLI